MTTETMKFPELEEIPVAPMAVIAPPVEAPPTIKATVLAQFKDAEAGIVALATKYHRVAYDCASTAGMVAAVAARRDLRENGRLFLTRTEKMVKADVNDLKRVMADEVARLVAIVEPVENAIDNQIKAEEERKATAKAERDRLEAERITERQAGIAQIRSFLTRCHQPYVTADRVSNGINMLTAISLGPDWQEFAVPAENARCETLEAMRIIHAQLVEREAEAVRLETQRVEQERQAAEQASIAAEQAARQAELDRQQEKLEALHKASLEAEMARQQAALAEKQEEAEQLAHITASRARIAEIYAAATGHDHSSADDLAQAIADVAALDVSDALYRALSPIAAAAQADTLAVLERLFRAALEYEDQAAVINAQRAATADAVPAWHEPPRQLATVKQDATPTAPEPTLTLVALNEWLAPLKIDGAGLELLGFAPAGSCKDELLYHEATKSLMVSALVVHLWGRPF